MNPPPGWPHQAVSRKLANLLEAAAGPGLMAVQRLGVRLLDNTMLIPDVLVANREVVLVELGAAGASTGAPRGSNGPLSGDQLPTRNSGDTVEL